MARGKWAFKESDVRRAVKAVQAAGLEVSRVTVDSRTGEFSVWTGEAPSLETAIEAEKEIVL